jgi:hypothetical protein
MEVELGGDKEEVLSTLNDLESIVSKIYLVFNEESRGATKYEDKDEEYSTVLDYPKIGVTDKCSEAVISLLSKDWGKTPRSISELREAMEANAIFFPKTTLSGVLVWLVKKGRLRRFKDKKRGYLYITSKSEGE